MTERNPNPQLPGRFVVPFADVAGPGRNRRGTASAVARTGTVCVAVTVSLAVAMASTGCSYFSPAPVQESSAPAVDAATAAAARAAALTPPNAIDGIVASIDGDPITITELKRYGVEGAPFLPAEVRKNYASLLNAMIENRLLKTEYAKNGISANDAMVDRYIAGVLEDSHQTRARLEADIAKAGLTWKDYYERMREEVQRIQLVNLEIRSRVNVPEEEVRQAWEADPQFLQSEKFDVGVIFVPAPLVGDGADVALEKANQIQKEARSNFAKAAEQHSKGPGADDGGHIGEFERGTMAPHYEKALNGLGKGDVSVPVEGPGGLYIVKLLDVKSAARTSFEEVKEPLSEKLYDERLNQRYLKWMDEDLRKDHRVDIVTDTLVQLDAGS